jgi:hypothetical protein
MNNELESQLNEVTLFHFLALLRRGCWGWGNRRKLQETLVKIVSFRTDTELLKAWINAT